MADAVETCPRCGGAHQILACPFVKAVVFDGGDFKRIRRLEFLTPADCGPQPAPAPAAIPEPPPPDYPRKGGLG